MKRETVCFTREELYELVWSKPMTTIAAGFGMSSVAFAKHCKNADVPYPGRGYWARVAAGYKEKRTALPKPKADTPNTIEIEKGERGPRRPHGEAPSLTVVETLAKPHRVVKELSSLVGSLKADEMGSISGNYGSAFKVAGASKHRALLLLDALFKAVEARGHAVRLTGNGSQYPRYAIEIGDPSVKLTLIERLDRSPHLKTAEQQRMHDQHGWSFAPKYDFAPSARFVLGLDLPWGCKLRKSWSDGERQRLEDVLGDIVLVIEAGVEAWRVEHEKREQERRREEAAERRRERDEKLAEYQKVLRKDLRRMAKNWQLAANVRAFLKAVADVEPQIERGPNFNAWFAWANEYANGLDPLTSPDTIAKRLEPRS